MKCPKCSLENPPESIRCDCGYNFQTKEYKPNRLQRIKEAMTQVSILYLLVVLINIFVMRFPLFWIAYLAVDAFLIYRQWRLADMMEVSDSWKIAMSVLAILPGINIITAIVLSGAYNKKYREFLVRKL